MTVLSAASNASKLLGKGAISALITSSDPFHMELVALCNDVATDIAKRHDWNILIKIVSLPGDGVNEEIDLPDDYDRMTVLVKMFRLSTERPMHQVEDHTEWLQRSLGWIPPSDGDWILTGGQISVIPIVEASDRIIFTYVSNYIRNNGTPTGIPFGADTDLFRLPERLLTLGLVWRWRQMKGLDYAEDMATFETALAQEIARDKSKKKISVGQARIPDNVMLAYPDVITP